MSNTQAIFIEINRYGPLGRDANMPIGGGVRAISRSYRTIDDPTIHLFIVFNKCGIKNSAGDVLFQAEGDMTYLKRNYSYNICMHKTTGEVSLFVESGINNPFYLPLEQVK